jgi:hypothetical protein
MVKAKELVENQKKKEEMKNITFDKIYTFVEKKIKSASDANFYYTWYIVPQFIVGLPTYKIAYCRKYIQDKLIKDGFKTEFYQPNILLITWN